MKNNSFTIDNFVNNKELNILKAVLPLLPGKLQRFMAIFIAMQELSNIFALLNAISNNSFESSCNHQDEPDISKIFEAVKKHLDPSEAEAIDNYINMMNMMNIMNQMSAENEDTEGMNLDALKAMLNPEQSAIFDTLSNIQ